MGRRLRRRFEPEVAGHLAGDLTGERVTPGRIEREEFVDGTQFHKTGLLDPVCGNLPVKKAADFLRLWSDP